MRRITALITAFILVLGLTGCGTKSKAQDASAPKKVIDNYFVAMRDKDPEKYLESVNVASVPNIPTEPEKLKEYLTKLDETSGKFKNWTIEENPHYDELNGQSIIKVNATTEKYYYTLEFDVRRYGDRWTIYSVSGANAMPLGLKQATPNQQSQMPSDSVHGQLNNQ